MRTVSWWNEFEQNCERFDAASVAEALADVIIPRIPSLLLRREAQTAADTLLRHLNRPASPAAAEAAALATVRLAATVARLDERALGNDAGTTEVSALCHVMQGEYALAAVTIAPITGTAPLLKAFVSALRLDSFGADLALRLLTGGNPPAVAVRAGEKLGRYNWWPAWLREIVTERVLAGTLCGDTIAALKQCAFAGLTPTQARMAKRLFAAEPTLVETTASRLESLGEHPAAALLRRGDVRTVAFAARLIPV
ncbi:hypothetical protein GCM10010172_81430 [Paractinoplanes ferrugineus]|uniref:Uncharacterized protein n=1 Tax=Paractinoplanes ferrugineus TaxID=113564 RepID=A0A919J115_9ACTN|nr:hypothetical protein [Actinoplanes ferrugineus]GIE10464.1 hypothetical protein Afe05nite_23040 [Actinoplanes ferrugineus]